MNIAVLFDTYLSDRKGLFAAIVNRTKNLMKFSDCSIHMYCLQARPGGLNRLLRKHKAQSFINTLHTEGLTFHIMWYRRYFIDDVLTKRFNRPPLLFRNWVKKHLYVFSTYDLITAHSAKCGEMARLVKNKYEIPYFVTWHGTDTHTVPFRSSSLMNYITIIMQSASCNFFVSKALSEIAYSFASGFKAEILYNGVSDNFVRYDTNKRNKLREKYGIGTNKVIAFAGNLVPVKNVILLPEIFSKVKSKVSNQLLFWIIGDGFQKIVVEEEMREREVDCVFWGNRPLAEMPDLMNCVDVLVLPSKNESFGLVLVEALACGANAVGSKVGGIPEVIGEENTFGLDDDFVDNISDRIVYILKNDVKQDIKKEFSWKETARKEYNIYKTFIYK